MRGVCGDVVVLSEWTIMQGTFATFYEYILVGLGKLLGIKKIVDDKA